LAAGSQHGQLVVRSQPDRQIGSLDRVLEPRLTSDGRRQLFVEQKTSVPVDE